LWYVDCGGSGVGIVERASEGERELRLRLSDKIFRGRLSSVKMCTSKSVVARGDEYSI
jgi:hypothetical protein